MLQEGHLQQKINENDTLFQQTSTITGVGKPNSAHKSGNGCSTLLPSEIATVEELLSN